MDMGTIRGLLTAVLLLLFIGVVLWAFSRRRSDEFAEAARVPLADDKNPTARSNGSKKGRQQ